MEQQLSGRLDINHPLTGTEQILHAHLQLQEPEQREELLYFKEFEFQKSTITTIKKGKGKLIAFASQNGSFMKIATFFPFYCYEHLNSPISSGNRCTVHENNQMSLLLTFSA